MARASLRLSSRLRPTCGSLPAISKAIRLCRAALVLDALWQLLGFYLGWTGAQGSGRALGLGELKFTGQVLPETKLVTYHLDISRVINRKLVLGVADGQVLADGKVIYEAKDLKVGLFDNPRAL